MKKTRKTKFIEQKKKWIAGKKWNILKEMEEGEEEITIDRKRNMKRYVRVKEKLNYNVIKEEKFGEKWKKIMKKRILESMKKVNERKRMGIKIGRKK